MKPLAFRRMFNASTMRLREVVGALLVVFIPHPTTRRNWLSTKLQLTRMPPILTNFSLESPLPPSEGISASSTRRFVRGCDKKFWSERNKWFYSQISFGHFKRTGISSYPAP